MDKQVILTRKGPKPVGPYSQAIRVGPFLFISGQVALDPKTGVLLPSDIETETARTLENLKLHLEDADACLADVVSITIFLVDIRKFDAMNDVYRKYFSDSLPTRTCVGISNLIGGLQIELNAVAYVGTND